MSLFQRPPPSNHNIHLSGSASSHRPCSGAIIKPTLIFPFDKELIIGPIQLPGGELLSARFPFAIEKTFIKGKYTIIQ